jgi:DNA topoisomerase-1
MDVVVVESPAKAKTINKYLGDNYVVLASYGHVRDLPSKDGSVRPDDDFAMDYIVDENSSKHMGAIAKAAKNAETLILATDPDREGEAISWHVMQALKSEYGIDHLPVQRVVFNEITKKAVQDGIANPRGLDMNMVNAQQARRALDYLVGFTLSPVLWRKLPGAKSAGRVQSVALRLVCERELEIDAFNPQEYWSITVDMKTVDGAKVLTRLTHLQTKKLEKFDLPNEATAMAAVEAIKSRSFTIGNVETKPTQRHPQPPLHHVDIATGSIAETALCRTPHHANRAAPL